MGGQLGFASACGAGGLCVSPLPLSSSSSKPSTSLDGTWHRQHVLSGASRALLEAVKAGDARLAQSLLLDLAVPDCCDATGLTPLHAAAAQGRADIARLLLDSYADVAAPVGPVFDGPPAALAARSGHAECLEVLLLARASPEAPSGPAGQTCAHRASAEGHTECLRCVLRAHAPTTKVVLRGGVEETLLEYDDLIANFSDGDGRLPLHLAAARGHVPCVEVLIREGFSLLNELDANGDAAIHLAAVTPRENTAAEICRLIAYAGGDVDVCDARQRTPLHIAAARSRVSVCHVLLCRMANVQAVEAVHGRTPLHSASRAGCAEVCAQLLQAHADPYALDHLQGTPLMCSRSGTCGMVLAEKMRRAERKSYSFSAGIASLDNGGGLAT